MSHDLTGPTRESSRTPQSSHGPRSPCASSVSPRISGAVGGGWAGGRCRLLLAALALGASSPVVPGRALQLRLCGSCRGLRSRRALGKACHSLCTHVVVSPTLFMSAISCNRDLCDSQYARCGHVERSAVERLRFAASALDRKTADAMLELQVCMRGRPQPPVGSAARSPPCRLARMQFVRIPPHRPSA